MKFNLQIIGCLTLMVNTLVSCGKKQETVDTTVNVPTSHFTGEEAEEVREKTIIELLAIKRNVKTAVAENRNKSTVDDFMLEVKALRPRLEYIKMKASMLPESEKKVIRGELAVATNQLNKDLQSILNKQPANDELVFEVANLKKQLSPIELDKIVQKF